MSPPKKKPATPPTAADVPKAVINRLSLYLFAPVTINLPENISRVGVDLAIELEQLSFSVVKNSDSG